MKKEAHMTKKLSQNMKERTTNGIKARVKASRVQIPRFEIVSKELKTIDISRIPELVRIAEEVYASGESRVLRRRRKDLVVLRPLGSSNRAACRGKPFTKEDSLWNIVGIGRSGLTDVSENKHKYLAEAYATKR